MHRLDCARALADGSRHPLHCTGARIPGREDPGDARLERNWRPPDELPSNAEIDALEVPVRPNGAIRIERDFREPARGRLGADGTEQTITAQVLRDPGRGGHHDAAQRPVATERSARGVGVHAYRMMRSDPLDEVVRHVLPEVSSAHDQVNRGSDDAVLPLDARGRDRTRRTLSTDHEQARSLNEPTSLSRGTARPCWPGPHGPRAA